MIKTRPQILLGDNIPRPLHGLAPRVVLGDKWWNQTRRESYESTKFHCLACGVHKTQAMRFQWLEGHEIYETDYQKGRMVYKETVPLCHYCHNYIHDGRMRYLLSIHEISHQKYAAIIKHGDTVLLEAGLKRLPYHERDQLILNSNPAPWDQWRLVVFGVEYPPPKTLSQLKGES